MKKLVYGIIVAAIAISFTGCGLKTAEYAMSADNVTELRKIANKKIAVDSFSAVSTGEKHIMCRLAETISTPRGESFSDYIEDALKTELKMAGLYDQSSKLRLSGKLIKIYGSSMLGDAYWEVELEVKSSNGKSIQVHTKREYPSAFLAYTACNNMASSFSPTIRQLITDIINHKDFNSLLN